VPLAPRWVPRLVLEAVHLDQLREHGGMPGLRDEHALEAALARPQHKWHDDPDSDLATLAAAYSYGLSKAHPFNNGNTRAALLAALTFLGLNGKDLDATEEEAVQVVVALASGTLSEDDLASWLCPRLAPLVR
jgi:death on curing protein